jgi:uncharacterized membrane protein
MPDPEFVEWLAHEVEGWQQDRTVTGAQANAILTRCGLAEPEARRSHSALVLAFLGAALVGLGVIIQRRICRIRSTGQEEPEWSAL